MNTGCPYKIPEPIRWLVTVLVLLAPAPAATYYSGLVDNLPFRFEENRGQASKDAVFIARGPGYQLEVSRSASLLVRASSESNPASGLRTEFAGVNRRADLQPEGLMPGTTNYFIGKSPKDWHANIPNYARLRAREIYPGIDLVLYGRDRNLEYDFVILAGADPRAIEFKTPGAKHAALSPDGDLVLTTGDGEVRWRRPVIYQESRSGRQPVNGGFHLAGRGRVRFWLGEYDHARPLVIDPVLAYATYFGARYSSAGGFEVARAIGADAAGNVYVAGISASNDLPVTNGVVQTAFGGMTANLRYLSGDAFVAKFTPAGAISYVTYLGGSGDDAAFALAVDSAGNVYITGATNSSNFPTTTGVLQPSLKGTGGNFCTRFGDAFVAKLNPLGTKLLYSTYLGGSRDDFGTAIAIDGQGNAYVAGATLSNDFPTVSAVQSAFRGAGGEPGRPSCDGAPLFDGGDAFVAKLNPTASSLVFSTYLGGSLDDVALAIGVDTAQNVYVGGFTLSQDFPVTSGALQTAFRGSDPQNEFFQFGDGFVTKLNASGSTLGYSTFLGGAGDDAVWGLTVDNIGTAYVTGWTSSPNFPATPGAVQRSYAGYSQLPFLIEQNVGDAFVSRLDRNGATLLYSTFLGGSANDGGNAIAVDPSGLMYVTGRTDSPDFPISKDAAQKVFGGDDASVRANYLPIGDAFFAILDPNLPAPVYSTFFGGAYNDEFNAIVLDSNGTVWLTGHTESTNLNVTANAAQKTYSGGAASLGGPDPSSPVVMQAMVAAFSTVALAGGPVVTGLTNAASNQTGALSPGMIFVAYGTNLGSQSLVPAAVDPASGLLSATRAGTAVLFDNVAAPLLFVSGTAVSGTVPYEVAGKSSTQVVVEVEGQRSAPLTIQVQPTAPGVFSLNYSGTGQAVADQYINGQGTLNSPANPVAAGTLVAIYVTGDGQSVPAGQDGLFANTVIPKPVAQVTVTIGGVPQPNIQYAGAIPGEPPGALQINFIVADGTPSGAQQVVVQVGGVSSQTGLNLYIQ